MLKRLKETVERGVFAGRTVLGLGVVGRMSARGLLSFSRRLDGLKFRPHLAVMLHASCRPGALAVASEGTRLTYGAFDAVLNRFANSLRARGLGPGAKVAFMMHNSVDYVIAQEAVPRFGGSAVQIGYRLKAAEVAHIFTNSEPDAVIIDAQFASTIERAIEIADHRPRVVMTVGPVDDALPRSTALSSSVEWISWDQALEESSEEDVPKDMSGDGGSVIVYTSGTTGKPKGAKRSLSETGVAAVLDMLSQIGASADEKHLIVCPLYHSAAPAFGKMVLSLGGAIVVHRSFDPEAVLETIEREKITSAFMVPTQLSRLASVDPAIIKRTDTSSLRWVMSGAAPLPSETAARFQKAFGPILWNFYGATETGTVTLAGPADHAARPGTVGRLLRETEALILDDDRKPVPAGEVGELWIRNSMIISGYHGNAKATADSSLNGYFSVGDLARLDPDGFLFIESRKHDMIISGGVNIYPAEIEDVLHRHPAIREAAVIGRPDAEWGESICAFVVVNVGREISTDEIESHCRSEMADYKRPRHVQFIDELPRNPTGKVLKRVLRESVEATR